MEIEINGKKTTMRLDLGAVKIMNKLSGKNFLQLKEEDYADLEVMAALVYACAHRGNKKITMEDVDSLKISELTDIVQAMGEMFGEFMPAPAEKDEGEAPLESRQD
jgi:hypothetical protein